MLVPATNGFRPSDPASWPFESSVCLPLSLVNHPATSSSFLRSPSGRRFDWLLLLCICDCELRFKLKTKEKKMMMMMIEASLKTYSDEELECLLIQADEEGDSQLLSMIEDEQIDREE